MTLTVAIGSGMPVNAQQAGQAPLTDESLRQMLDGLGLASKKLSKGFLISVKRDTFTIPLQLVISADQRKLGINANCGEVPNPDAITAAQWRALLAANEDIDPSSFYFDNKLKKLYLHRVLDNRALTPDVLREEIERFAKNVRDTGELWKFTQ